MNEHKVLADERIRSAAAVLWPLYWSLLLKNELRFCIQASLFIDQSTSSQAMGNDQKNKVAVGGVIMRLD